MLEQEVDKQEEKPAPTTDITEPAIGLLEANKRRVKLGSIIGGGIFLALLITIIVLLATSSPTPLPPKPQPKKPTPVANPFRIMAIHEDDPKHMIVTIKNNRTALEKNVTSLPGKVPDVKNTTENEEPVILQARFIQLDEHLLNVRYNDPQWPRWEVPEFARDVDPYIHVSKHANSHLGVGVLHKSNQIFEWNFFGKEHDIFPLMTTENCRLQFFDKYIEFEARLQTDLIYGMGERVESFTLKNDNYSLWNRDLTYEFGSDSESGTYSSHPFFLNKLKNKKDFIGVFMRNSNAMLFSFWHALNNGTTINYKMIGGIVDLYVFHAADPDYILKKYHSLIGRPYLPPVWGMGFHQARRGYTLEKMKEIVSKHQEYRIPIESIWADVDMNDGYKTFTVGSKFSGLKEFVQELHDPHKGIDMHFVAIANPGLKKEPGYKYYDEALKKNCLIKSAAHHEDPFEGRTLAGSTVWLDFFVRDALLVWAGGLHDLKDLSEFDGIWISENEVTHMCDGECKSSLTMADYHDGIPNPFHNTTEFDYIQYRPTLDPLERSTLSMTAYQCCDDFFYKQYYTHNLYGLQVTQATFEALHGIFEDKRFLVVSRSTWPGSGHYGSHWLGDNYATWESMIASIPGMLNFNMFGIPHVGAAIGGYIGNTDSELLARWYELGAFYPLMLSYSGSNSNNKEAYADEKVRDYIKHALLERYGFLRFMYTKIFEAFAWGGPVVHPLFFEFPEDEEAYNPYIVDRTFMWAKTLYVIPALIKGQTRTRAYLPNWRWYDVRTGELIVDYREGQPGEYFVFDQPLGHITVLVKGGSIVPYQRGARDAKIMNTEDLKKIPALIVVAPDHTGKASGTMVVDADGIRPHPHPMSHTYRHYAFTYMNQIFRINKLAGFDFHEEYEFDYFWDLIILDVFGQHSVDFVCMMNTNFFKKELQFNHVMDSNALIIHDERMAKIPMFNLESIVWGTKEQHDFCRIQLHVENLDFPPDEKTINGVLASSDPEAYRLKYDFKAMLLTDKIISVQIAKQEHGRYPWIVPDVVDENVRHKSIATKTIGESGLRVAHQHDPFYFELADPIDSHDFIFTTRNMPFVYVKDFIHLKFMVNSRHIFGLGERIGKFDLPDGIYSMFNRDHHSEETGLPPGNNMYGSHPFYVVHLHNPHEFAGVFFLNSNPIDVKIRHVGMQTQIDHIFTGGIIDAFFLQRGSIKEVIRSYQYLIGRPEPLPYWAFGYHQSRWGYRDIEHLKDVVNKFEEFNIPCDAIWMDKDYMDQYKDFTVDRKKWYGLKQFVQNLHSKGKHFVAIVDAAIAIDTDYSTYNKGLEMDVYIKSLFTAKPLVGVTWPGYSVWVDYLHPSAEKFWEDELELFHQQVEYDGLWLDMNEPTNFCDGECPDETHYIYYTFPLDYYDDLYYNPSHRGLERGTISMEGLHHGGTAYIPEYNYHNLFGLLQSRATARFFYARLRRRPFIISSATFPGIGRYASHWLGDNHSSWHMMEYSIAGMLNFQLFGIPFVGADICGFDGNSTISLCSRWMQLGAFYPFMRNHNSPRGKPQEPYVDPKLASVSSKAIRLRYSLARYMYSSYMHIVLEGGMYVEPILFHFPADLKLYDILDTTFMLGEAIRVTPVLQDKVDTLVAYFPNAHWYDFYTHQRVVTYNASTTVGKNLTLSCSLDSEKINLHIKGGSIIAYHDVEGLNGVRTITQTWNQTIKLIVAQDAYNTSKGFLFYDRDEDISIFNRDFHDVHLEQNNNELKFIFENGKESFNYPYKDNIISEVVVIGAKGYQRTACAKITDRATHSEKTIEAKYVPDKDEVVIDLSKENVMAHKVEFIRWYESCQLITNA
eukprot:TRINITY_DN47_c0_g3_i5.p1 TRINITY_DN47_c0_g3~~TRINITY_DN47_c0_g3_i5.p1  ORF type:complete len:1831 (+),score=197.47 TRINITY_DN47_c0_g3_i5:4228-9720(+)